MAQGWHKPVPGAVPGWKHQARKQFIPRRRWRVNPPNTRQPLRPYLGTRQQARRRVRRGLENLMTDCQSNLHQRPHVG